MNARFDGCEVLLTVRFGGYEMHPANEYAGPSVGETLAPPLNKQLAKLANTVLSFDIFPDSKLNELFDKS